MNKIKTIDDLIKEISKQFPTEKFNNIADAFLLHSLIEEKMTELVDSCPDELKVYLEAEFNAVSWNINSEALTLDWKKQVKGE